MSRLSIIFQFIIYIKKICAFLHRKKYFTTNIALISTTPLHPSGIIAYLALRCIRPLQTIFEYLHHFSNGCLYFLFRLYLQGTRTIVDNLDSGVGVIPILTNYEGIVDCYESTISQEGVLGLYKGFGALLMQYAVQWAVIKLTKFLVTEISILLRPAPKPRRPEPDGDVLVTSTPRSTLPSTQSPYQQFPEKTFYAPMYPYATP